MNEIARARAALRRARAAKHRGRPAANTRVRVVHGPRLTRRRRRRIAALGDPVVRYIIVCLCLSVSGAAGRQEHLPAARLWQ
jgi:hypothetical protein